MSPLVLLIVAAMLIAAWRADPEPEPLLGPEPVACTGRSQPVDEETLLRTLARFGFELEREDYCEGSGAEPAAMYANITDEIWDEPESDVIFASDGQVWCDLYPKPRFGAEVSRRRVDEDVVITVLNVECTIWESDAWQIERLDDAVHQLARAR